MSKQPLIDQLDQAINGILANPDSMPASADPSLVELLRVARDFPRPDFKTSLKADLERKAGMSTNNKAVAFRPGFRTITPYLLPQGLEFIDFLKNVFDAEEMERVDTGPGRFHAEYRIGDSMLMVGAGSGRSMPMSIEVYVPNADEVYKGPSTRAVWSCKRSGMITATGSAVSKTRQEISGSSRRTWAEITFPKAAIPSRLVSPPPAQPGLSSFSNRRSMPRKFSDTNGRGACTRRSGWGSRSWESVSPQTTSGCAPCQA
jgi:hypothetical protein